MNAIGLGLRASGRRASGFRLRAPGFEPESVGRSLEATNQLAVGPRVWRVPPCSKPALSRPDARSLESTPNLRSLAAPSTNPDDLPRKTGPEGPAAEDPPETIGLR